MPINLWIEYLMLLVPYEHSACRCSRCTQITIKYNDLLLKLLRKTFKCVWMCTCVYMRECVYAWEALKFDYSYCHDVVVSSLFLFCLLPSIIFLSLLCSALLNKLKGKKPLSFFIPLVVSRGKGAHSLLLELNLQSSTMSFGGNNCIFVFLAQHRGSGWYEWDLL